MSLPQAFYDPAPSKKRIGIHKTDGEGKQQYIAVTFKAGSRGVREAFSFEVLSIGHWYSTGRGKYKPRNVSPLSQRRKFVQIWYQRLKKAKSHFRTDGSEFVCMEWLAC